MSPNETVVTDRWPVTQYMQKPETRDVMSHCGRERAEAILACRRCIYRLEIEIRRLYKLNCI